MGGYQHKKTAQREAFYCMYPPGVINGGMVYWEKKPHFADHW